MSEVYFSERDFEEDELILLKMAFRLVDDVVEIQRSSNYDVHWPNVLFRLKEKLGVGDIV